ncbi:hypothetical protein BH10BDE1_BH10BDE1_10700 [soil metagenome]
MPKRPPVRMPKSIARATAGLLLASLTLPLTVSQKIGAAGLSTQAAEASNQLAGSQRANSRIIILLIASSREENPVKALELLGQAREELKKEHLGTEDNARILAMIEDLEAKAKAKIERTRTATPTDSSALAATVSPSSMLPIVADLGSLGSNDTKNGAGLTTSQVENALATHPEVRDTLWEIGRGRLSRDTQNLDAIIQDKTGKTPAQLDTEDAANLAAAYKPGIFIETLRKMNILNVDVSKANLQLKQEYDGISLDILANQLTRDAMKFSVPAGFLQGTLADVGFGGKFLGLSGEAIATFAINTNLALRISDLYGIEMSDSEKEIVLLLIFTSAKISTRYGPTSGKSMMTSLGENLGRLKFEGKTGALVSWLQKTMKVPAIAAVASPALEGSSLVTTTEGEKAAVDAKTEAKSVGATGASTPASPKKLAVLKSIASRINFARWMKSGLYGARSGIETFAVGQAATWLFSGMHQTKRKIHNENFRRFLMTPSGEGFMKLLVLAMNDGVPSTMTANAADTAETKAKVDFIVNIAKSARICTDDDLKSLAKGGQPSATAAYACQTNPSTARFTRLKNEILTFNEIPQDYVADLRIVSREHRLRMADLILQMQFLDGDRTPSETEFFRKVVAKSLGVDAREDLEYFERLHSFIQESGGMARSNVTPTGFTIRSDAKPHSYDMDKGYSPLSAPEPPPGERYLGSGASMKTTTTITTTLPVAATVTPTTAPPATPPVTPEKK